MQVIPIPTAGDFDWQVPFVTVRPNTSKLLKRFGETNIDESCCLNLISDIGLNVCNGVIANSAKRYLSRELEGDSTGTKKVVDASLDSCNDKGRKRMRF